jgi:hypothetical protein
MRCPTSKYKMKSLVFMNFELSVVSVTEHPVLTRFWSTAVTSTNCTCWQRNVHYSYTFTRTGCPTNKAPLTPMSVYSSFVSYLTTCVRTADFMYRWIKWQGDYARWVRGSWPISTHQRSIRLKYGIKSRERLLGQPLFRRNLEPVTFRIWDRSVTCLMVRKQWTQF